MKGMEMCGGIGKWKIGWIVSSTPGAGCMTPFRIMVSIIVFISFSD